MRPSDSADRPAPNAACQGRGVAFGVPVLIALVALAATVMGVPAALAQSGDATGSTPLVAPAATPSSAAPPVAKPAPKVAEELRWQNLTAAQRVSLAPLADEWSRISENQRKKWLAVARDYPRLSPQEQTTLQSRMKEWVALGPKQRAEARLNFAEAKKLSPEDRKAKWDAYQSLSPEEREKLASNAPRTVKGAAPALRPVPSERLARVPPVDAEQTKPPRIAATPQHVDHNTLLPQPTAQ